MKNNVNKHVQTINHSGGGAVYGMGFLGAVIYYLQHADSIQSALFGFFKAIFWPAFFVYKAIELMKI
jgi:hypothetical protein